MVKAALKADSLDFVSRRDRMHNAITKDRIYKAKPSKTAPQDSMQEERDEHWTCCVTLL